MAKQSAAFRLGDRMTEESKAAAAPDWKAVAHATRAALQEAIDREIQMRVVLGQAQERIAQLERSLVAALDKKAGPGE